MERLARRVLLPLLCGGAVQPVLPIGVRRAQQLCADPVVLDADLEFQISRARLRRARRVCPLDDLPPPGHGEWLLCCAFNDLLQACNPTLAGLFGARRPLRLLEMVADVVVMAGAPRTSAEALARHATFGSVPQLRRLDTHVSWWTGARLFVGQRPPQRLLSWPRVRRVRADEREVVLHSLPVGDPPWAGRWRDVLALWLSASPLTDLAFMHRPAPEFTWTSSTLGVLAAPRGRRLALCVLREAGRMRAAVSAARRAAEGLPEEAADARRLLAETIDEMERQAATFSGVGRGEGVG